MIENIKYRNFIEEIIQGDINKGFPKKNLLFRFPPEPNGFLHIGHAKSMCLNFGLQKKYNAFINLRFDDTNPIKEENIYVNAIKKDIQWLGFYWNKECYASDFFKKLYKWALQFIQEGNAYVDEQTKYIILKQRKTSLFTGINSPYRNRPKEESLVLLKKMSYGKFLEGNYVVRAKINMKAPNMNMRDPIMFRILKVSHHRTQSIWNIYPTYDWTHGLSDLIEKVSHSLCSLEFESHRPLYSGYLNNMRKKEIPKQIEFSRLNLSHNINSKRKLLILIQEGFVEGWDDARLLTLNGLKNRGYLPVSLRNFCYEMGISKRENVISISRLEFSIRELLNKIANRVMVVLEPIKLEIENYPESKTEWFQTDNNQEKKNRGKRKIPFSKILYIEREDFMEVAIKKFHRLSIGKKVRLKNTFIIKGSGYIKDIMGNIIKISAVYDFKSNSVNESSIKKIKGTLHWVNYLQHKNIEARLYEFLFIVEYPDVKKKINIKSLKIMHAYGEPLLHEVKEKDFFQFHRIGYFSVYKNSFNRIIINRIVTLNKTVM